MTDQGSCFLWGECPARPRRQEESRFWTHLKVLPAASNTTAKCVGGGSSSNSPSNVRKKAKRMDVSSPVEVARRTSFSPKWARYSRANASKSISLQQHPALETACLRLRLTKHSRRIAGRIYRYVPVLHCTCHMWLMEC